MEAIELGFRQRIRPLLLDRILRRQHQKRLFERIRIFTDGDLLLLHRLQQGALHLGRSAVDFVGQNEVGEDRAFLDRELAGARIVNLGADDVRRQQIGRELDAFEAQVQAVGQGAHSERFRQAGDAFEQHVAAGQQAENEPIEQIALADDDAGDLR